MEELMKMLEDLHPEVDFANCETLIDDGILDSFDIVTLIAEISDEFDIRIGAQHIIPENFNSAKALWNMIGKLEEED